MAGGAAAVARFAEADFVSGDDVRLAELRRRHEAVKALCRKEYYGTSCAGVGEALDANFAEMEDAEKEMRMQYRQYVQ